MIIRCKKCLIPHTRPEQVINKDGICNACISHENKKKIDWNQREQKFLKILDQFKSKNNWDCIIPSSGGKDSHWQALKLRDLGMKPLLVTATTCHLSKNGRQNLDNLKKLGFDTIEVSPNIEVRKILNKLCLELVGDIAWPEHVSIFTVPVQIALKFNIPLIVWGENPQFEYGGPVRDNANIMDRKWLEEFGGLLGLRKEDLLNHYKFNQRDLLPYTYPEDSELKKAKVQGVFLGYYFNWNNLENFKIAKKNGFTPFHNPIEGGYYNFEKIDNLQHGIHDYFKFLKYGFGRATDQLSFMIRNNLIDRKKAYDIVKEKEGKFPKSYLEISTKDILSRLGISNEKFVKICDQFTNKKIFACNNNNQLIKDSDGNLILKEK